ncbi:NADPH-dependent F420 reductase, partial [Haladaptatus sp. W1]|uniref:NADPH-dependent F420 reductase n=1 Tax=Haladaptatus sp. W1 TaxID=1897478 RepID=UPI00158613C3
MSNTRIGVLGSGDVGKALGRGFAQHGWDVLLGTRSPEDLRDWQDEIDETVAVGSFSDAASYGDTAVLAVFGGAAEDVCNLAGPENFDRTLVLDTTNPLDFSAGMPPGLLFGGTDSL